MGQMPVVTVEDLTRVAFRELRPGCDKGVLQEDALVQSAVFRVQPGSGVPTHLHSRIYDLFVGVKGELEIRYEGQHGSGVFRLAPGRFCSMPPGVRHEVSNPSRTDEAYFLIVHATHEDYDNVPVPFRELESVLPLSPRR